MAPVEYLVADASAFLRGAPLQEIGRRVYTTREVLAEIRDRAARRRLAGLPFELLLRQPFPEHVRLVSEFSKQTGDFRSLSAADIQVLALTLQLEAEHGGGRPLRTEPRPQVQLSLTHRHPEAPVDVPGFHVPPQTKCPGNEKIPLVAERYPGDPVALAETEFSSFLFWRNPLPNIEEDLESLLKADPLLLEAEDPEGQESGEEEGWITPRNIEQMQQSPCWGSEPAQVQVGCITTDFAMQNVLLQMGLHVLAFNGLLIQHARSYILHCHGCFRTTSKMTRLFCPHCGNKTLKKVAVTVKDDGSFHLHFSQNPKVLNPRGLRHSLPAPQGGKHASNPHLTEDQRFPQQRLSRKARQKTNAFDPDYVAGVSPFAEHDIHSRAANLQIRDAVLGAGRRRLNPNMSRKKCLKNNNPECSWMAGDGPVLCYLSPKMLKSFAGTTQKLGRRNLWSQ
uniref:RNA-binding protein NOB1 n=1 Tax=Naja naja TaxID=35670 RepID=A0A8C6XWD7_NAJNA